MTYKLPSHIKASPIYLPAYRRIWDGGNWNWIFDGAPRTGKSTSCLQVGDDMDITPKGEKRFDVDFSVCMSYKVLLKKIDEIGYRPRDRGRVLIWEEASGFEGANSRQFASEINIKLAKIAQIVGIKGILLLINLPSMYDLDKQIRKLCHAKTSMLYFNRDKKTSVGSFTLLQPHFYKNEIFESKVLGQENNYLNFVRTIEIPFAKKELYDRYLEIERSYKEKWFRQAADAELNAVSKVKVTKVGKFDQVMDFLKPRFKNYIDPITHEVNYPKLRYDLYEKSGLNCSQATVSAAITTLKGSLST